MDKQLEVTATQERPPVEALQAEIERQRAMILAHCKLEVEQVLAKHGCALRAIPQIAPNGRIVAITTIELAKQNNGS